MFSVFFHCDGYTDSCFQQMTTFPSYCYCKLSYDGYVTIVIAPETSVLSLDALSDKDRATGLKYHANLLDVTTK